jgi:phosphoribosyl 1,2-cyclic phosphate phosphodiesterase
LKKITLLGTGTSTGVPIPGCNCNVCKSTNEKNQRLRCSIYLEIDDSFSEKTNSKLKDTTHILIDTSTDLRQQALKYGVTNIDAVLYTHTHADHIFGIDDLRAVNFIHQKIVPVYASLKSSEILENQFKYCFSCDQSYEGGTPPRLTMNRIEAYKEFCIGTQKIIPLPVQHGQMEVFAFRFDNFAYVTDCSRIPEKTKAELKGLDVLILDGLREVPHKTHFTLSQAVDEINKLKPKVAYLTHISHDLEHELTNNKLKEMSDIPIELAYDGLILFI